MGLEACSNSCSSTDGCYDKLPQNKNSYSTSRKQGSEVLVGALPIGMSTCVSKPEPLPCTSMYYIEVHGSSSGLETHDVT